MKYLGLFVCLSIAVMASAARGSDAPVKLELKDGDRVALIGNTFIEREQDDCYIETMLTSRFPDRNITFRNLGYSADTVTGSARGLCTGWSTFEAPDKAFERLRKLVAEYKPTVLLLNYGMTESFSGPEGIPQFVANYNKMLDALIAAAGTSPRIVLMSPNYHEDLGRPLPDPTEHNKNLTLFSDAIATIATQRKCLLVDLFSITKATPASLPFTSNGIHLTPYGYWCTAVLIGHALGYEDRRWVAQVDASGQKSDAIRANMSGVKVLADGIQFTLAPGVLPAPPLPPGSRSLGVDESYLRSGLSRLVVVPGLADKTYELSANAKPLVRDIAKLWRGGVPISEGPDVDQAEALRKLIVAKNFDFFNYQRPDNDAYILAFRRGEQGRNAPEIPKFLPLVEEKEKQIAELRVPKPVTYTLEAVK